jgi:hypothetical protein
MNIFELLTSGKDYITLVKESIRKVFVHESRKYKCKEEDLSIILGMSKDKKDIQIMIYSNTENKVLRILSDKEAQEILMK